MTNTRLIIWTLAIGVGPCLPRVPAQDVWTLDRAADRVLESDESLAIAGLEVQATALLPELAMSKMGPNLTMNIRNTWPENSDQNRTGNGGGAGNAPFALTLEKPLFDLTVIEAYRREKLATSAARHEYRSLMREVLYGLAAAYYQTLSQEQVVEVLRETADLAKETLDLAQKRVDAGEVTRTDALRAAAQWRVSQRAEIEGEGNLEIARRHLANILNLPEDESPRVTAPGDTPVQLGELPELYGRSLRHRDDLRAQELTIDQDVQRRREIVAAFAPRVSFQISALSGQQSPGGAGTLGSGQDRENWQGVLSIQVPFLAGGQRKIEMKSAAYRIEQSHQQLRLLRQTVQEQVHEAWVNVKVLHESMAALEAEVEAAAQGYTDLKSQYAAGTATSLDVLDSLRVLNSARTERTRQHHALQVALRRLDTTLGTYQEARISRIVPP